jgi:hypothetical protein
MVQSNEEIITSYVPGAMGDGGVCVQRGHAHGGYADGVL